ncbi:MAG: hypothetical protein Q8Q42_00895 [Nanoarchaeota archaeon]|nr:hypothetical protein [Nanoarchaeota archaeon]
MKKLILLLMAVLLLSSLASAQTLRIDMIGQDDDPALAGDIVELRFKMENLWKDTAYDVKVEVLPEYPFSAYSNTVVNIGRIEGTSSGLDTIYFDYKLKIDQNASDGEHEIKLKVTHGDVVWIIKDQFYVDVENKKLALKPYIVDSNIITDETRGKFTIEIANIGGLNVEALELQLLDSGDYRLLSTTDYVYLGNLESDDTESEDFDVYVEEGITEVNIPVLLKYVVNNVDYEENFNLRLDLLTENEAIKLGLVKKNNTLNIILVILIIIIVFFFVRKYRKR